MAQDTAQHAPVSPATPARDLLPLVLPALVVGAGSSLLYLGVSGLATLLQHVLWGSLPDSLGIGPYSVLWMLVVLTATGVLVGLVVWKAPGHAGPDPATVGLSSTNPLPPGVVPGLLVAGMLMLAGGPSLGPENPVLVSNVALAYWLGRRLAPRLPGDAWVSLAESATIGALFGTPVAAALLLSEALAGKPLRGMLWDNVFGPLIAAAMGALTTSLLARRTFDLDLPAFGHPHWQDLLCAMAVASAGALLAMMAVYALPYVHAAFGRLQHPMVALSVGGLLLGILGAIGGRLTLFKGLDEVAELARNPDGWSAGEFADMAVVKLAALVVAASCGFRGGRIFPSVFIGAALGLCAHAAVPAVHPALGVAAGVLGVLLAVTRAGWLSLFTAALLAPSPDVLALLCIASLPAWLLVTGRPQMQLREDGTSVR